MRYQGFTLRRGQRRIRQREQGVVLFVVLVLVLLAVLGSVWAARTALFNEIVVGNDADYQRAYEAAEAMLQDAELDIREQMPNGKRCQRGVGAAADVCRPENMQVQGSSVSAIQFPLEEQDFMDLLDRVRSAYAVIGGGLGSGGGTGAAECIKGICIKRSGAQDFWNDGGVMEAMEKPDVGARYGQFTGAVSSSSNASAILDNTTVDDQGAWYWVEVFQYAKAAGANLIVGGGQNKILQMSGEPYVAYRITAVAHGLQPETRVVLQENYMRYKHNLDQANL